VQIETLRSSGPIYGFVTNVEKKSEELTENLSSTGKYYMKLAHV
jgi:hypothetical protein